jgi:hypothetical protein
LEAVLKIYTCHFNGHYPHHSLAHRPPTPPPDMLLPGNNIAADTTASVGHSRNPNIETQ